MSIWRLKTAIAQFRKLFEMALKGEPQAVTFVRPPQSLVSFLLHSPLRSSKLHIPHSRERYVPRVNSDEESGNA